jgi:hypothetical protein
MNKYVPTFEEFINEGVDYKTTLKLFKDAFSSFNKKFKVPFNEDDFESIKTSPKDEYYLLKTSSEKKFSKLLKVLGKSSKEWNSIELVVNKDNLWGDSTFSASFNVAYVSIGTKTVTKTQNFYIFPKEANESYDFTNEATTSWKKMMQGVKSSETGPWSLVAIENKKVVGQKIDIRTKEIIPAYYEAMRKEFPRAKIHIEDGTGMIVWNESLVFDKMNESATFDELRSKFEENPYGIGAQLVIYEEGVRGNPDRLIFKHDEKHRRDQIESRLKTLGVPSKNMSKYNEDKAFKYRYELILTKYK